MDFLVLVIIWLWIFFTTYKLKIEKKWGLLFILFMYVIFLWYSGLFQWWNTAFQDRSFLYSQWLIWNVFDLSAYLLFYVIFYVLWYSIIFLFKDKELLTKNKYYYFFRDSIILFSVFLFFCLYIDVFWKYKLYNEWYVSEENFWGEEYICMDNSAVLLLQRRDKHKIILNPYKNFLDFYDKYGWYMSNTLPEKLVTQDYLTTCMNSKRENYYHNYYKLHNTLPVFRKPYSNKYILEDFQVEEILEKLKEKEYYINNLIKYSYKEFGLNITVEEFDNDFPKSHTFINEKINEKRTLLFPEMNNIENIDYFERIPEIKSEYSAKSWKEYSSKEFGLQEWFYKKLIKESGGWVDFFKEGNITYSTTKTSLYKWTKLIFKNDNLNLWTSWPFSNLWKVWELFTFEFNYFDTENNQKFQDKQCDDILFFWKDTYWNCFIKYNEDQTTQLSCDDPELLTNLEESQKKYLEYKECHKLKYENITNNIWLWGEVLNKKYNLDESKNIFEYNDNIWFVAKRKWQYFIMYNWLQISEFFSWIRTKSCCMFMKFPFKIYDNWVLEYVFSREEKLYIWYIQL